LIRANNHEKTTKDIVLSYVVKFYRIFQEALYSL